MSELKLSSIISFSSEDSVYKAENLLLHKKWIGIKDNETLQYVKIKLNEPSEIRQIEIENESSAFIEVQAGSCEDSDDDYSVILPAVSFMTPKESKAHENSNRFKIFIDDISKNTIDNKWQIIKIICTQPFNTNIQFGISFIKIYKNASLDENKQDAAKLDTGVFGLKKSELTNQNNAQFSLFKSMSVESGKDDIKTGSVFEKWKNSESNKPQEDEIINQRESLFKKIKRKKSDTTDEEIEVKKHKNKNQNTSSGTRKQILKGVIFALSGFVNPLRSEIRDTGLKLGAKYRPDWNDECTHLICAFSNTPKANQVRKSGGIIVTKEWLFDSEKESKLIETDDYILKEESGSDSDDDTKPRKAAKNAVNKISKLKRKDEFDDSYDEEAENSDDKDFIVNSSEEISQESSLTSSSSASIDSSDSEKVVSKKKKKKKNSIKKSKKSKKSKEKEKIKQSSSSSDSSDESDIEAYKLKKEKELIKKK